MRWLIILLSVATFQTLAQSTSLLYRWYPIKERFPEGDCVQTGTSSDGKEYVEKLKPEACRPAALTTIWVRDTCYEVDVDTQGQSYGKKVDVNQCAPKETALYFNTATKECWLVDQATRGEKFRRRATLLECRPNENELKKVFVPRPQKLVGGDCLEVHKDLGDERWAKKLDILACKPSQTKFVWLSHSETSGECWESAETSAQEWSQLAKNQLCRPSQVTYVFKRESQTSGTCFEVDQETKGRHWAVKVPVSSCNQAD